MVAKGLTVLFLLAVWLVVEAALALRRPERSDSPEVALRS